MPKNASRRISGPLPSSLEITVCGSCLTASCWQGKRRCRSRNDIEAKRLPMWRLTVLSLEGVSYWEDSGEARSYRATGRINGRS